MKPKVLLVDDSAINTAYVRELLDGLGVDLVCCPDGHDAVSRFLPGAYACVFMDCQMPALDGFEAATRIRALENAAGVPPVPIIAVTASGLPGMRDRCLAAGMNEVLCKPFMPEGLFGVLARYGLPVA